MFYRDSVFKRWNHKICFLLRFHFFVQIYLALFENLWMMPGAYISIISYPVWNTRAQSTHTHTHLHLQKGYWGTDYLMQFSVRFWNKFWFYTNVLMHNGTRRTNYNKTKFTQTMKMNCGKIEKKNRRKKRIQGNEKKWIYLFPLFSHSDTQTFKVDQRRISFKLCAQK